MTPYRGGPPEGGDGRTFNRYATEARRRARRQLVGSIVLFCALALMILGLPLWTGGVQGFVDHWHPRLLVMAALAVVVVIAHLLMRWRHSRPDAFMMKLGRETDAFLGGEAPDATATVGAPEVPSKVETRETAPHVRTPRVRVAGGGEPSNVADATEEGAVSPGGELSSESHDAVARRARE